jgi:hypothetical protein
MLPQLFKRKQTESQSLRSGERGSQFKVVSSKRNSLFAMTGHPAGWVNRMDEKESAAGKAQGQDWRSEV